MTLRQGLPGRQRHASVPGEPDVKGRDKSASVRARLLNKAKAEKQDFNLVLTRCVLERLPCR